jgi:hypothetical protein
VSQYRDPLAGLRSQVATKRAALGDREREVPAIVRAMLPPALRTAIEELRPRADAQGDDLEALTARESALDGLLAAYEEAAALAPKLRKPPDDVADPPRPALPPPWLIEEPALLRVNEALAARIEALTDGASWLARWGDFDYLTRLRLHGAPLVLHVACAHPEPGHFSHVDAFTSTLRTSVPSGVPHLELRRERVYHAAARAMHLAKELSLGDEVFDSMFWIRGAEPTATLLVPRVRRALLGLASYGPSLVVGDGLAVLCWSGAWPNDAEQMLPDAAVTVLAGIRDALAGREVAVEHEQ